MKKNQLLKAFSLPEILLALTIIGVISAITVPTLKDYSDEMTVVSQVKKAYSDMAAATAAVETKYGDLQFWPWSDKASLMDKYGTQLMFNESSGTSRTTQNGFTWSISDGKDDVGVQYTVGGVAVVDINNSINPPNKAGVDLFAFRINKDGVVPFGSPSAISGTDFDDTYSVINTGKVPSFH